MGAPDNRVPHARGKQAMHDLARATFAALEEADLEDALGALRDRVLARGIEIVDITVDKGICRWSFKPMVELLLRHALEIAGRNDLSASERRCEIAAALHLAGY